MNKANDSESEINSEIAACVDVMKRGGIILYPTDTVWGIGCDATNSEAVKRIYNLKRRVDSKAMIVLVDGEAMLERHVDTVPDVAWELLDAAVNPLTVVFDRGAGSIGIRITHEKFSSELCRKLRRPVVSTSANISGMKSARFFNEIANEIIAGVDYVAKYRQTDNEPHKPSSVIKLTNSGIITILRP